MRPPAEKPLYVYCWRNNAKRQTMTGRVCRLLWRGARNSAMIEFTDNGQREIVSRNALRKHQMGSGPAVAEKGE